MTLTDLLVGSTAIILPNGIIDAPDRRVCGTARAGLVRDPRVCDSGPVN